MDRRGEEPIVEYGTFYAAQKMRSMFDPKIDTMSMHIFPSEDADYAGLSADGIPVDHFPFTVGRQPTDNERSALLMVDLPIPDGRPYRLSRIHFTLIRSTEGYVLSDTASKLGTVVNGKHIGGSNEQTRISLSEGTNHIVAGGEHSPFRFDIHLDGSDNDL